MPNIKSAKKRVVVNENKNLENRMVKSTVKTAIRKYNDALASGDVAAAEKLLPETVSVIDSAVSKGILHKNNAANKIVRRRSRKAMPFRYVKIFQICAKEGKSNCFFPSFTI